MLVLKFFNESRFLNLLILSLFISLFTNSISAQENEEFNAKLKELQNSTVITDSLEWNTKKWTSINMDHKFFMDDSTLFIRNQVLTLIPKRKKYMEHAMSLKYYPDTNLIVSYNPTLIKKQLLFEERGYLNVMESSKVYTKNIGPVFSTRKKNEELFISSPHLVKYVWKTIPEPQRIINERRHLSKKSAQEGIKSLLPKNISYTNKLEEKKTVSGPWTISGTESVQLSQAYLENWTQGGENTITLSSDLLLNANYKKDKIEWENYIRHKLGVYGSESYQTQFNTDNIELNSKYGIQATEKWYYSTQFNFNSQLFNGYNSTDLDSITSGFMAPAYLTLALGMDYKKSNNFSIMLSPLTAILTYVMDTVKVDQTGYDIDEDKKTDFNVGASIENDLTWTISTELSLQSALDIFFGYLSSDAMTQIDWELIFNMRINRFLSTKVNTQLRYYTNESNQIQFKENFTVSFNYKF